MVFVVRHFVVWSFVVVVLPLIVCCGLLVVVCCSVVYWLVVDGCLFLASGDWLMVVRSSLLVVGCLFVCLSLLFVSVFVA